MFYEMNRLKMLDNVIILFPKSIFKTAEYFFL